MQDNNNFTAHNAVRLTNDPSEGPYALKESPTHKHGESLPQYRYATDMTLAHNILIRSLNAIYIQAPFVSDPKDVADFLTYCQCWLETVWEHHAAEEEYFFPRVEKLFGKPGLMAGNVEQHEAFHHSLDAWGKKCYETAPEDYNAAEWRRMIDEFSVPLIKHLHDEIETLEDLVQYDPDGTRTKKLWDDLNEYTRSKANKRRNTPIFFSGWDSSFEGGIHIFPNGPFFLPYLVDWIHARKHRNAWRFSPSDMYGRARRLHFVSHG